MSMRAGRLVTIFAVGTLFVGTQVSVLGAQEAGHETEEAGHGEGHGANALAVFLGGATHLGSDGHDSESGVAFGLEYVRTAGSRLKIGALAEYASIGHEDDLVLAVPFFLHLTSNLLLVAAPGMDAPPSRRRATRNLKPSFSCDSVRSTRSHSATSP